MTALRDRMDEGFGRLGRVLFEHPLKTLAFVLAVVAALGSQVPKVTLDTSFEALLHEEDASRVEYDAFRDQFGRDELIILAVGSENVFDPVFLKKLKRMHGDLEAEVPYVERVYSLVNARSTRAEGEALFVEYPLEDWPERDVDLSEWEERIRNNPQVVNNLVSPDGRFATIIVESRASTETEAGRKADRGMVRYLSAEENQEIVEAVHAVADRYRGPETSIAVGGTPVAAHAFFLATISDAVFTSVLVLLTITGFLALLFRRISGIALPWLVILGALTCTCGLMGFLGIPLKITTTILPSFLFAVGVGDSVHLLSFFYRRIDQGSTREDALASAMAHSGVPILMTSLTTVAGLLSFSLADLAAIAELGAFTAFGCIVALLFTLFLLPPLLAILPIQHKTRAEGKDAAGIMDRVLSSFADLASRHPAKILITSLLLFVVCLFHLMGLRFSHDTLSWLPEGMAIKEDSLLIDRILRGSIALEVVLDTAKENGLYEPAVLERLDRAVAEIGGMGRENLRVGKVLSVNDIIKEMHQALNHDDPAYYRIPHERKEIAEEFLLFEMSDSEELGRIVDERFAKTRVTIRTPWMDAVVYRKFIREISDRFRAAFRGEAEVHATGMMAVLARTISATMKSMVESYVTAFAVITILMMAVVASVRIGLLSMLPNLLPIVMVMGFMAAAKIPMDVCSIMIGSVAIGLVVDDTVHFLYNFQRYFSRTGDAPQAVLLTLQTVGRAMLTTSLILSSAFFVVVFASLKHTARFGYLTGMVILLALLADFVLTPALMILVARTRRQLLLGWEGKIAVRFREASGCHR